MAGRNSDNKVFYMVNGAEMKKDKNRRLDKKYSGRSINHTYSFNFHQDYVEIYQKYQDFYGDIAEEYLWRGIMHQEIGMEQGLI